MNKIILMGRLTREPDIRYTQSSQPLTVARFTLAVDRRYKKDGEQEADFISCIAFGKLGDFVEKYLHKGIKICLDGRLQTGSFTNKDGEKRYTTDVIAENIEFAEAKKDNQQPQEQTQPDAGDFINIPDNIDAELPFN